MKLKLNTLYRYKSNTETSSQYVIVHITSIDDINETYCGKVISKHNTHNCRTVGETYLWISSIGVWKEMPDIYDELEVILMS